MKLELQDLSPLNEAKVVLLAQERNPTHSNYSHTAGGGVMDSFSFFLEKKKKNTPVFVTKISGEGEEMENDHLG